MGRCLLSTVVAVSNYSSFTLIVGKSKCSWPAIFLSNFLTCIDLIFIIWLVLLVFLSLNSRYRHCDKRCLFITLLRVWISYWFQVKFLNKLNINYKRKTFRCICFIMFMLKTLLPKVHILFLSSNILNLKQWYFKIVGC